MRIISTPPLLSVVIDEDILHRECCGLCLHLRRHFRAPWDERTHLASEHINLVILRMCRTQRGLRLSRALIGQNEQARRQFILELGGRTRGNLAPRL